MGRVKNGRIAKALREASREPEPEARVAIFAVHVGMFVSVFNRINSPGFVHPFNICREFVLSGRSGGTAEILQTLRFAK